MRRYTSSTKLTEHPQVGGFAVYMGNYISDARNVFGIEVNTDDIPELANGTVIVVDEKETSLRAITWLS